MRILLIVRIWHIRAMLPLFIFMTSVCIRLRRLISFENESSFLEISIMRVDSDILLKGTDSIAASNSSNVSKRRLLSKEILELRLCIYRPCSVHCFVGIYHSYNKSAGIIKQGMM